jgi:hypothetical protein
MASALAGGLVLGDCWTQVGLKTMDCASAPGCDPGIAQSTIGITRARQLALAIRLNSSRRVSSLNPFFISLAPSATSPVDATRRIDDGSPDEKLWKMRFGAPFAPSWWSSVSGAATRGQGRAGKVPVNFYSLCNQEIAYAIRSQPILFTSAEGGGFDQTRRSAPGDRPRISEWRWGSVPGSRKPTLRKAWFDRFLQLL